jgi:ParB-like chromosome segregation protein Spo0J
LALESLGERYRRYRLSDPSAEEAMARSLRQYGQQAPVVVCRRESGAELVDGFKRRLAAARLGWATLSVRVLEADEAGAKAAIYGLNRVRGGSSEWEEAWIVHALVREDGLTQVEAAELLGHHKSWVCRRLALLERLGEEAKAELRLGLLAPSLARELARLPVGNQSAVLTTARRESLTVTEARGVIELLRGATPEQERLLLEQPREALLRAEGVQGPIRDYRLSPGGNRAARQLRHLLDALAGMENWLRYPGLAELKRGDRELLQPRFERLSRDARAVAALAEDLLQRSVWEEEWLGGNRRGRERAQRDRAALASADAGSADRSGVTGGRVDGAWGDRALAEAAWREAGGDGGAEAGVASAVAGGARGVRAWSVGALPEHDGSARARGTTDAGLHGELHGSAAGSAGVATTTPSGTGAAL